MNETILKEAENTESKVSELTEKLFDLKKEIQEKSFELLKPFFSSIFDLYPNIESIGWRQYSLYFNDGDVCEFSPHIEDAEVIIFNGSIGYHLDDNDVLEMGFKDKESYLEVAESVSTVLSSFPYEIYEDLYGNHKEITFTREGIEIEDYTNHD